MKHIAKSSALLISLSLTLASLPLPAFSQALRNNSGRTAAPSAIRSLPITSIGARIISGGLADGSLRTGLTSRPLPTLAPSPISSFQAAASAAQGPAASGAAAAATPQAAALAPQAAADPAMPAPALLTDESASAAPAPGRGILSRFAAVVASKLNIGRVFDNSRTAPLAAQTGFLPTKPVALPNGAVLDNLDPAPQAPDPKKVSGISIESFEVPGAHGVGSIFSQSPEVLSADPASEADVERALRELVDNDPIRYGVPSSALATVHLRHIAGQGHQADTIYAYFHQQTNGIKMHGGYLSFTIKVLRGKPIIMSAMAQLYPTGGIDTVPRMPDEELKAKAIERLGPLAQTFGLEVEFLERKIIFSKNAWHTANIYMVTGTPVVIAVDVVTGQAFAWDPRAGTLADEVAAPDAQGTVLGRSTVKGPTKADSAMAVLPLQQLNVRLNNGKTAVTKEDGTFTADPKATNFKASLSGSWAEVHNQAGADFQLTGELKAGENTTVTFNPAGMNEEDIAQVNGYWQITKVHDWAKTHGLNDARLDQAIPVNVNIDDDCNAYYTPWRPSLNFFKSSERCVNSAYDTVAMHEYGHFVDDMLGGIVNGGLSEGWGDIFSMYILNNPIIGEGFMKIPRNGVDYIRHGENNYQYGANDEVHAQGQAWMGFAWKLRKGFMAALGEAAGAALAEALVVHTLLAKASDIPSAMAQVLLSDMDQDGNMPHEAAIRAAASAHGITLPQRPGLAFNLRKLASWLASGLFNDPRQLLRS
ncbi:MAG: hypothetical protein WC881_01200 [Elusimicrobiota bacterium]|jgi:hypothetical protein